MQCYKRILELDPENIQGFHNLCVVHVERGKLLEAQSCLEEAHKLAPGEDYILKHLQIVQNRIKKTKVNSRALDEHEYDPGGTSKVVSNKSIDESERKTEPLVSGDKEEQRYSSHVVNTEPMFVKNVDNIDLINGPYSCNAKLEQSDRMNKERANFSHVKHKSPAVEADTDDPSSGMS